MDRFDGETWSRFLEGRCIVGLDIAPDGGIWLLATGKGHKVASPFVITPEAVGAAG